MKRFGLLLAMFCLVLAEASKAQIVRRQEFDAGLYMFKGQPYITAEELQALEGVTSKIQDQLDERIVGPTASTDNSVPRFDGATGKLVQGSSVVIDDNNAISGLEGISSSGVVEFSGIEKSTSEVEVTVTGLDASIPSSTATNFRLTDEDLTSVSCFEGASAGRIVRLFNDTGREVVLRNNVCNDEENGFYTGTNKDLRVADKSVLTLIYNATASRWLVMGGSGSGGGISAYDPGLDYNQGDIVHYDNAIWLSLGTPGSFPSDDPLWLLISGDIRIRAFDDEETYRRGSILEVEKLLETGNNVYKIEDHTNLLINPSFDHKTSTFGWTVTSLATATQSTSDVLEGNKKVCISGVGSIYQLLDDTDKFHGRKFVARLNIQNPNTDDGKVCLYDGTELTKCIDTVPSTEFREYVIQDTFISGKTYGLIYTGSALNDSCIDKASIKLDSNEAYVAEISNDTDWQDFTPEITATTTNPTLGTVVYNRGQWRRDGSDMLIRWNYRRSVNGTAGSGKYLVSIPNGYEIDTTKVYPEESTNASQWVGTFSISYSTSVQGLGKVYPYSSTKLGVRLLAVNGSTSHNSGDWGSGYLGTSDSNANNVDHTIEARIPIKGWKARSQVINYPDETFSPRVNGVYWSATKCSEKSIGCYNTYPYGSGNTVGTICSTRPTQTDEDIKLNGFRIYTKSYSGSSTCALPARFEVVIGKGYSYPAIELYKNIGLTDPGFIDMFAVGTFRYGMSKPVYDSKNGTLLLDAAQSFDQNSGSALLRFIDGTTQNNGYLVISATKNGGALANVPARYVVKVVEDGNNWAKVYNDGWVEQYVVGTPQAVGGGNTLIQDVNLLVPTKNTSGTCTPLRNEIGSEGIVPSYALLMSTSLARVVLRHTASASSAPTPAVKVESYGAASYLWDNFGIKVNY